MSNVCREEGRVHMNMHVHVCVCVCVCVRERLFIIVSDQILPSGGGTWASPLDQ